jgi:DNA polymerase Ligase (LigD)
MLTQELAMTNSPNPSYSIPVLAYYQYALLVSSIRVSPSAFVFRGFNPLPTSNPLMKRRRSSESSAASFVTADSQVNLESEHAPHSLKRTVSPPPTNRQRVTAAKPQRSSTAAVEAGEVDVEDHVAFFSEKLLAARQPEVPGQPQLDHGQWLQLYQRSLNRGGHHFVVHQHDHPVAGTHYDLRLQCNATSSISFAIMYGLPGDPNSRRLSRNATETRVHNLWNHLIETASHQTGTMLIWDTGEYEVLPYYPEKSGNRQASCSDSGSESGDTTGTNTAFSKMSEPEKLAYSFHHRKIRLRLHGTRLPANYTIGIRLTIDNDRSAQPKPPSFKRGRKTTQASTALSREARQTSPSSSSSASSAPSGTALRRTVSSLKRSASPPSRASKPLSLARSKSTTSTPNHASTASADHFASASSRTHDTSAAFASDNQDKDEDQNEAIRLTNAYPGATNSIGSIHQRKWYLSLDRRLCGFTPIPTPKDVNHHARTYWVRSERKEGIRQQLTNGSEDEDGSEEGRPQRAGFERFHVLGRDIERSVITGRLAADILRDEGVENYVPRGRWRGFVE